MPRIMQDNRDATMVGRRTDGTAVRRPLSPHLQVYDMLQMTSALSISNRVTGAVWGVGLVFLVWWLVAAASGPGAYATLQGFMGTVGIPILMGLTAAVWYHTLGGIRHLLWDWGWGFDIPTTYRTGWAALIGTAVLTAITWLVMLVAWL